ncbi:MAG: YukJ family protein [Thermomicrobiales bacterium]|nr:YukJ family protein [Thermomicrobiales bacterium]
MARVYTLAKGRALSHRVERGGKSPHFQILLECHDTLMRLAINTRSGSSKGHTAELLYLADDDFRHPLIELLTDVPDGVQPIPSRPGGLAIDYQRGHLFDPRDMRRIPASRPGARNDLSDELLARATRAINHPHARVYAYGTRWGPELNSTDHVFDFTPGNGIHDIHMNQGNTDEHRHDNGTWADGALFFSNGPGGPWTAIFLAFQTQSWRTDTHGNPIGQPVHYRQ